jgi:hypothetical protein
MNTPMSWQPIVGPSPSSANGSASIAGVATTAASWGWANGTFTMENWRAAVGLAAVPAGRSGEQEIRQHVDQHPPVGQVRDERVGVRAAVGVHQLHQLRVSSELAVLGREGVLAMIVLARGGGSILYFLPTLAFLVLGMLFILRINRLPGDQSPPREGQEDDLAAKVLGDEEAQELHRRARRKRALRRRNLKRQRRNDL